MNSRRAESRLRIVIDARPLSHPQPGGFRSYVRSLVKGLAEVADEAEFLLYVDRPLSPETMASLPPGVGVRVLSPNRLLTDFFLFARQLRRDAPDLVHGTMNYLPPGIAAPTTLALHDALQLNPHLGLKTKIPSSWQSRLNRYFATMTRASAQRARRIVTPSRSATDDLVKTLRFPVSRFAIVPIGISLEKPPHELPRATHDVLAFVAADLRKGIGSLIYAVKMWNRDDGPPLRVTVIAANKRAVRYAEESFWMALCLPDGTEVAAGIPEDVRILCRPRDEEVAALYMQSAALLWPSLYEGFGLPPLEAMSFGCPVVSSSAPAMPEVLGDIPYYFDTDVPFDIRQQEGMRSQLKAALTDSPERAARIERGRAHAATFSCRRMAQQTMAVWREALNGGGDAA